VLARLHDRRLVTLRRIRPQDKAMLSEGLRNASPRSVHQRFVGPKPRFTSRELRYLTEVDFRSHYALVALDAEDPRRLLGVGRWIRDTADPGLAEVAVIIADDVQGQGLGTVLGLALADAARARGIRGFTATMHHDNHRAHRLYERVASEMARGGAPLAARCDAQLAAGGDAQLAA
jgi:RimJ/RimL family protein N-acetyltransferase